MPSILKLLPIDGPESDQLRRVGLLGQIDDPVLVARPSPTRRSGPLSIGAGASVAILKDRPLRDYAGKLVDMIHGIVRYEVQSVSGPNSRGSLSIDAPRFRMLRTYESAAGVRAGVIVPRLRRSTTTTACPLVAQGEELDYMKRQSGNPERSRPRSGRSRSARPRCWPRPRRPQPPDGRRHQRHRDDQRPGTHRQLSVAPVLEIAAGAPTSLGDDEDAWRGWWFDKLGYSYQASPKPTIAQDIVAQYTPYSITDLFRRRDAGPHPRGDRPIEAIQVGDQVLSQDASTGALSFQPVVFVHRNPPARTLRIKLSDGASVVCSVYHRFWRANLGWAQARELNPGDTLRDPRRRLVRGRPIEPDTVQPLYNLDVASSRTFFAGRHDPPRPRQYAARPSAQAVRHPCPSWRRPDEMTHGGKAG